MDSLQFTQVAPPNDNEIAALKQGLTGFNDAVSGSLQHEKIACFIKNSCDDIVGGIAGEVKLGWLHVDGIWVQECQRRQGAGSRLLAQLEGYAHAKGAHGIHIKTTNFMALEFYQQHSYEVFAKLEDMPPGYVSFFLKKELNAQM
ncbi:MULTISPECIES: GNAT family N-acetyltransferase [Ferrimonas]|uniref:GNAT family N-acetyltransferase n=1 Tax=Ferrimonas TaxID=44011 RepID=UPI000426BB35|nr:MULTISPECIES: GNAT family N-acetyltransferase [Ferrimonas]USD38892.1 GNAT family N-acetyltransferase [Ferrimonas sp. SCSIO 43195]